ncbi:TATA-box-binding protein-like [Acanthochromis polyacanthus]|uniref:TATA-box-binding protein-like n=1 Tax=Acanthochromis polyacanthus TaxID=80966 RepID=UPI0022341FC4|nr:TATA-box-binding protein-like [Acanthochromis polyacanthus]
MDESALERFFDKNVVSRVNLGCRLDLNLIARNTWNVKYNPKVFPRVLIQIRRPRTTASIFSSGVLICMGATSIEESKVAARRFARIMQKLGFPVRFLNFKIQLIMATCSSFPVSLERLALAHREHCSYEPELFPCIHYRLQPSHCMIISSKGNLTLKGN